MIGTKKIKLAVFDLTDCEGCELQFLALREKLAKRGHDFEVSNWRLVSDDVRPGPFDVTFIEGSPISETDIEVIKRARAESKIVVTLGTCAVWGGLQSAVPENMRDKYLKEIYGKNYKTSSKAPKPVSYYIDVDVHLAGCPVNPEELEKLLTCAFNGKEFKPAYHPVCLDCKKKNNSCIFVEDGFCLGPVTKGGCGAPCPSAGLKCYGCFGPMPQTNLNALKKVTEKYIDKKDLQNSLELYFKNTDEYKEYKLRSKK